MIESTLVDDVGELVGDTTVAVAAVAEAVSKTFDDCWSFVSGRVVKAWLLFWSVGVEFCDARSVDTFAIRKLEP